jgi:sugar lactone lactonase YvrE
VKPYSLMSSRRQLTIDVLAVALCLLCLVLAPLAAQAQNIISTYAGGGAVGTTASTVDLPGPSGVIRDAALNTYIAAPFSTYVFKVTGTAVSTFAGVGYENFSGDNSLASKAGLALPSALAIDSNGNIYIADYGNSRIRMVAKATGKISTVVGSGTKCEPSTAKCGDGGSATGVNAALNLPMAVAVDAQGNIYIADAADHRIRAVNRTSASITIAGVLIAPGNIATIAGTGNICPSTTNPCGDTGPAISAALNFPEGVGVDSLGNIYISDTRDNRIRLIAHGASTINTYAGNGTACVSTLSTCGDGGALLSAEFHFPMGLSIDPSNNLYIADSADQRIRFINVTAPSIGTVAGNGKQGFSGDGSTALSAQLNLPASVFLDSSSNLLISDTGNQRVRIVTAGNISTLAGGGTGGDGGVATSATFADPYNVAEDSAGNLYIADTANNRIRKVDAVTKLVSTVAGNGNNGYTGDGGLATSATLNAPAAVAVDSSNNIFIADTGNMVIRKVTAATSIISTVAGNGLACLPPPATCGDGGPATSGNLSTPLAIALDTAGDLLISDYTAQYVRIVSAASQKITAVTGIGLVGFSGNGGPAKAAKVNHPLGVAFDATGNVYFSDSQNNVIRSVTGNIFSGGTINAYALSGVAHLQGDGGPKLLAGQWNPLEVAMDPSGNLFIGGGNDNVVRRVDSITGTIGTVAGSATHALSGGFSGDGGLATAAKLSNVGLTVDGQSNLYIADAGNNRIRLVHLTPAATTTPTALAFPPTPLHQPSAPQAVTFKSTGGVDVDLTSITFGGNNSSEFSETDNCAAPANLGVDSTCTVTVTFTPLSYALRTATLVFNDNGPGGSQTVTLSGYGPYFTPSASPSTLTINPGSSGVSTITVTPFGNFNGPINLSCTGFPANSTCSIAPTSVTLDGTGTAQTATLTLTTTASTPVGSYTLNVAGTFVQGGGQLQYSTTIGVTIP